MLEKKKKKLTPLMWFLLQGVIIVYTFAGVMSKLAAGYQFMSWGFILLYGAEIFILGVYAILWQQVIKRVDLSMAYANRSIAIVWTMVWAVLFFSETITLQNIIGVAIILVGTMIVNLEENG